VVTEIGSGLNGSAVTWSYWGGALTGLASKVTAAA